jgi:CubicO group peptidase (beta-lactamase class C family)
MKIANRLFFTCLYISIIFTNILYSQVDIDKIEHIVTEYVKLDQFSGTVLVAKDGKKLYVKAFGEANKDFHVKNTLNTKYNIGSAGKTFTAISIMQLAEKDKLRLSDPVINILPEFPFGDKITIYHLLTHTSGIFNYFAHKDFSCKMFSIRSVSDALPLIYDQKLQFDIPGEKFLYSNSGMVILGAVIEKLSNLSYPQYIRINILNPVGMSDTGINYLEEVVENRAVGYTKSITGKFQRNIFDVPPANSDGGLETTVLDLLKYDQALYTNLLLSDDSKKMMFTPFKNDYACGWGVEKLYNNTIVGHSGGAPGVSAMFRRYLDDRYTVIVLSNYSGGASRVANSIEAILFEQDYPKPVPRLGEYLYHVMITKGGEYLKDHFEEIIEEGNYNIRSSATLNYIGYSLLEEHFYDMAINIFKINIRLYPNEANPYDSLGEAYFMKDDFEKSIDYYQKALKIDPEFENAKHMIKKINTLEKK